MAETAPRTLCEAFQRTAAAWPAAVALRTCGDEVTVTWREYVDRVRAIAGGLAWLGVGRGDVVALMMTNRPEFHLCDVAVLHTGATPFSVYNTSPPEVLGYQFGNADAKVVVCERRFLPVVRAGVERGGRVEHIVCIDGSVEGALSLAAVEAAPAMDFDFEAAWRAVVPDDLVTIVYTSGTTGMPKGVEITHANLLASAEIAREIGGFGPDDRVVSYLPDAHMANRWVAHYASMLYGIQITTVADPARVVSALTEVRPSIFLGVPRVWVKMRSALEAAARTRPRVQRVSLGWAFGVGRRVARAKSQRRRPDIADRLQRPVADLLLARVRAGLGFDRVRIAVSAAAPIPVDVLEFVLGLGIPVCEAWGLTEGTCALTINRPDRIKAGTVGTPVPGARIRLAADGEILARGPMIMRGYRKATKSTEQAIDSGGWLHTGDIGSVDADGYLRIIDRKKEIIINAAGKNMSPANIENAVAAHTPLAGPVAIIGDGRRYNTALVTLDPDAVTEFARRHGLPTSVAVLSAHPRVRERIQAGVEAANATLSRVEQIKTFRVLPDVWEPGGVFLTPTAKLKRASIASAYAALIDEMYR
ncbi:AMP-dependent synthetase/ligase [Nocardia terpenica]|uniref:Acyl-CoA synthetase n=1 Tax=Nocardia terpenica TaxID=455432 RepID=A0A6G9ZCQ8_9NOCA|nr:long-chain fatty acid--CoA ligase [Nocardia terpenica]QIS23395.1 AMP-binding protein [Nocardia terpenica]